MGPVLIVPRLIISEIWMGKLMMIHPLGVQLFQVLIMILMMMWHLGLPSTLIMAQGTSLREFMDENGVTVMGSLCRTPHAQYISWIREGLQQDPDGIFMGASLSILNGSIFNQDDTPIEFRSILDQKYELTSSGGEDWVSFSYLSVIMDQNPHGHPFTLLLTEKHLLVRPAKGNREDMDTDGSLTDGQSSDEDYSLTDGE